PSHIKAALLLGGLYDLKPLQASFLKDEIALTDAEVTAFSPITRHHDPATKVAILVGARETEPFHHQAAAIATHLSGQGVSVSHTVIVARSHMDSVRSLGDPASITGRRLVDLIRSV
ncbi:MAG: alpha/beta hydrolase, partial [Deltaproteobacteria bacterium]